MATYKGTKGVDPTKTGENRVFWHDRFVEPKQQHRFTIRFPVYTPVGKNKDVVELVKTVIPAHIMATAPGTTIDKLDPGADLKRQVLDQMLPDVNERRDKAGKVALSRDKFTYNSLKFSDQVIYINKLETLKASSEVNNKIKATKISSTGPRPYRSENIYLRIPEYIGYSFKPPGFGYQPKIDGQLGNGQLNYVPGGGKLDRSPVNLSFVTSLRDDMHFSLNFLWQLGWGLGEGTSTINGGVQVFPDSITDLPENDKYVVVYEHYARQTKDRNGNSINGINKYAISGIHKIKNPSIESVDFSEFSYGGAELIKVNVVLIPGEGGTQKDFYSYQNTESRYGGGDDLNRGDVYAMSEGDYHPVNEYFMKINPPDPIFGSVKNNLTKQKPNIYSPNPDLRDKTLEELKERKNQLLVEKNIERIETIRIIEGNSNVDKNSLVTKGISQIIAEREAIENRKQDALRENALGAGGESISELRARGAAARQDRRAQEMANQMHAEYTARSPSERVMPGNTETIEQLDLLKN